MSAAGICWREANRGGTSITSNRRLTIACAFLITALCGLTVALDAHADTFTSGASWYAGPCDHTDNNQSASGIPNTIPGIARYNRSTLGRFYLLTDLYTHRRVVVVQSDIGPAPWVKLKPTETGWPIRVDVNYTAASAVGYRAPGGCVRGWRYGEKIRLTWLSRREASRWARRTVTELDSHSDLANRREVARLPAPEPRG